MDNQKHPLASIGNNRGLKIITNPHLPPDTIIVSEEFYKRLTKWIENKQNAEVDETLKAVIKQFGNPEHSGGV